jgi:glycosyltransferase involved in cell wall biosynthesis
MFKNISKCKKLLVISDTGILRTATGFKAFGPVVKELEYLLALFDEITWIGFEKLSQKENASYIAISSNKITPILIKDVGGNTLKAKLNILRLYPSMFLLIRKEVKRHKFIHSRAPSNPSVIAMFLSLLFPEKIFWHKYAGSWVDDTSFFYKRQRQFLKRLNDNSRITINGNFSTKRNILSFENPCLDENDRDKGGIIVKNKYLSDKINFCFVGGLNSNKGIERFINSFSGISSNKIGNIHIVGDGERIKQYLLLAKQNKHSIIFHGFLPKEEISSIYIISHFIILPSKSEGFPKVIGEAMNFGCIPIVSDVSCIGQYIKNNKNGFLLDDVSEGSIIKTIELALSLEPKVFFKWIQNNYKIAAIFTYKYYNSRVKNEIFNG